MNRTMAHMEDDSSNLVDFPARLRRAIKSYGNANALAKAAGLSEGVLRKWVQGKSEPTRDRLVTIADIAGVRIEWLATGRGPEKIGPEAGLPLLEGYFTLPWLDDPGSVTGHDAPIAFLQATGTEALLNRNRNDLTLMRIPDDSMEPMVALASVAVVDTSEAKAPRDGIYALRVGENRIVRRLQTLPSGEIEVSADNPAFKAFRFSRADKTVTVQGRIIWVGRVL